MANAAHVDITGKTLDVGMRVLCEKPIALSIEQCETMVASGTIGKVLFFGTKFRHRGLKLCIGTRNTWFFDKVAEPKMKEKL